MRRRKETKFEEAARIFGTTEEDVKNQVMKILTGRAKCNLGLLFEGEAWSQSDLAFLGVMKGANLTPKRMSKVLGRADASIVAKIGELFG